MNVFISYARRDDADGWVSALCEAIYDDFRSFSTALRFAIAMIGSCGCARRGCC